MIHSLWETKSYGEAQKQFETAILIRRQLKEVKISQGLLEIIEKFGEVELKFRIAKCMVENQKSKEAAALLQPIPIKQRSAKINMLLVKIQQGESGTDKYLIAHHKEVLRKCPLAFECIDGLLNLGVKGTEVNSLVVNGGFEQLAGLRLRNISLCHFSFFDRVLRMVEHLHSRVS